MSEEVFNDELDDFNFDDEKEQRPTFLTVLIVLTWISVGLAVIGALNSLMNSGASADQIEEGMAAFDAFPNNDPNWGGFMEDTKEFAMYSLDNMFPIQLWTLVFYLLEGFAALLMFNLKKNGFWLYVACQIGFLGIAYAFYPSGNVMTTISIVSNLVISLLFVFLYGLNLKHLTK